MTTAEALSRIRATLAASPLTAGPVLVLAGPDPDADLAYRLERADYDDQEVSDPD